MNKTKILLIVLVVLFASTSLFLYTQNSSSLLTTTTDTKTPAFINNNTTSYDGDFFSLEYPTLFEIEDSSQSNVFYLQTEGWETNIASLPESYRIEVMVLNDAESLDEYIARRKAQDMGEISYENATIEAYSQNGFEAAKVTWPDLPEEYFGWGGQVDYYFYKDGKGLYLLGSGSNQKYIEDVARSVTVN